MNDIKQPNEEINTESPIIHCTNCSGTGKQVFHGAFESAVGNCNFCKGTGKRKDQLEWFASLEKENRNRVAAYLGFVLSKNIDHL